MNNTPNVFTSNSRFLPPPIRTPSQSPHHYRRSDCQRAAAFLNQDWTPTTAFSNHLPEIPLSPSSSELPQTRSDYSQSEDDSEDDSNISFGADSRVKRELVSPDPPFNHSQRLPHVLPDRRTSSLTDLQSLTGRRLSSGADSILVSRSLGNGSSSYDRGVRPGPYSVYHQQARSLPAALHPSSSAQSHPSGSRHRRDPSGASHSTGSPPRTPPTPSSPTPSTKDESRQSSSTASPPAAVNTDDHIQRISGGKSKCIWSDGGGTECGFQSSSSLVKRHIRTVHLKIRYVPFYLSSTTPCLPVCFPRPVVCSECGQSFATKFHLKTHQNIQ